MKVMKFKTLILINVILFTFLKVPVLAADEMIGCGEGFGPIAEFICGLKGKGEATTEVGTKLNQVLGSVIGFLIIVAALWFFIQFIIAGFNWINAGGDKTRVEQAQKQITNAIIGITIVVAAWVIVGLIGQLLGLDILNPGSLLENLILK